MTASAPASAIDFRHSTASASSSEKISVLRAT